MTLTLESDTDSSVHCPLRRTPVLTAGQGLALDGDLTIVKLLTGCQYSAQMQC